MPGALGTLRRRLLTPDPERSSAEKRGFHIKNDAARATLEAPQQYFRAGFGHALETADPAETAARLEALERPYRGFAYEGAAMGLAICDVMSLGRRKRVSEFIDQSAGNYAHQVHVGLGFALARMPRFRWRAFLPSDSLLRWRTLDGYGFHQGFFNTDRYVRDQYQEPNFPWPQGHQDYPNRVIDQGIGRASWFVAGGDVNRVAEIIGRFDPRRRGDLWSGTGLAATYAGAAGEQELKQLWELADGYHPQLAQGAAFAATTRVKADLVNDHTRTATSVFCGMQPEQAVAVTDEALKDLPPDGTTPAFEVWRQRIQQKFA